MADKSQSPAPPLTWETVTQAFAHFGRFLVAGFQWLGEHQDDVHDFLDKSRLHKDGPWGYLIELVDGMTGMSLLLTLEAKKRFTPHVTLTQPMEDAIAELVERGLHEQQLLAEVREAIGPARLDDPQRKQLLAGIDHFENKEYESAVPLLIVALEGAFWHLAEERGLVVQDKKGKWQRNDASRKRLDGVEALFPLQGLNLDEPQLRFLRGLVYGGTGNAYRHGTAAEGYRLRALCLFVSLIAWLESAGELNAKRTVMEALGRQPEARCAVDEAERRASWSSRRA